MSSIEMPQHNTRTFVNTVVDIFLKSSRTKIRDLPMIKELKLYFRSLDSVSLVYHERREKKFITSDHFYVVFKSLVGLDAFVRVWQFWDDAHFLKANFTLQQNPNFLSGLLYRLQDEADCAPCANSESPPGVVSLDNKITHGLNSQDEEHVRFIGPAFALPSPPELEPSPLPASPKRRCKSNQDDHIDQEIRAVRLEAMLEAMREVRDHAMEECARLAEEQDQMMRERVEYTKERVELIAQVRSYKQRLRRYNNPQAQRNGSRSRGSGYAFGPTFV